MHNLMDEKIETYLSNPKIWFSTRINQFYSVDFTFLHLYRKWSDGLTFLEFHVNWDKYEMEHNPSFDILFAICNMVIIQFDVYKVVQKKQRKKK